MGQYLGSSLINNSTSLDANNEKGWELNECDTDDSVNNMSNIFSNSEIHRELFRRASKHTIGIPIDANNVSILREPKQYYDELIKGIESARCRIVISSLYLGSGKLEQNIVKVLERKLEEQQSNPDFSVTILLDCLRGSRIENGTSSINLIHPLMKKFPSKINLYLFHTPELRGLLKYILPQRVNEVIGVQHMKLYIFDNDLMISGANLSDWYFDNRQDRYMTFRNEKELSNYFSTLVHVTCTFSYCVNHIDGSLTLPHDTPDPVTNANKFKAIAEQKVRQFLQQQKDRHAQWMAEKNEETKQKQQQQQQQQQQGLETWVFPSIQMGPMNIVQDEKLTCSLLSLAQRQFIRLLIASAYFNVTKEYTELLLKAENSSTVDILTAAPRANGFFTAKGISRFIPHCYSYIEECFFRKIENHNKEKVVRFLEYERPGWTFHAKGLWMYSKGITAGDSRELPLMTMIGSPNFGYRSVKRDIEAQILLLTNDLPLRLQLHDECNYLQRHTQVIRHIHTLRTSERRPSLLVSLFTKFFGYKFL